jgi:putative Mn2+ efflux pump MntP
MKKKIYEYMTIINAVIGTMMMIGAVGMVETNQWISGLVMSVLGVTMFILSLYSQELYKEQK